MSGGLFPPFFFRLSWSYYLLSWGSGWCEVVIGMIVFAFAVSSFDVFFFWPAVVSY